MTASQAHRGAEPIPGYQLVLRLGSGGYGEVWKARAPGGLSKAVKIVYGRIGENRAEQELKALRRIQEVRHPFLLSLERYEIIDGQLIIVTELADMSLMDRFEECRGAGLQGIPRDELLAQLHDAADALDYMGAHYGLQHLDIKPQNLLLVGGRTKIGDFGLVKELQGTSVTATGGVTPHYATPEAFNGRISRFSDQYSLAIVYQEMLTGVRPFSGTTAFQLATMHTSSPPFLEPLPKADRPIVERGLAKVPEDRFPTCRELIETLSGTVHAASAPAAFVPRSTPRPAKPQGCQPATIVQAIPTPDDNHPPFSDEFSFENATSDELGADLAVESGLSLSRLFSTGMPNGGPKPHPTLFLGIGGIAGSALQHLRLQLNARFGSLAKVPFVRLLLLDTDPQALALAQQGDRASALTPEETLLLPLRRPEHYRSKSNDLLRWLSRRWLYGIPRSQRTEGLRPLGRLAFIDNAAETLLCLRNTLTALTSPEARTAAQEAGLGALDEAPRIWIVASISGGTGGGALFDAAYAIRQLLEDMKLPSVDVRALLIHATSPKPASKELARCNAYATLHELSHFSRRDCRYPGDPSGAVRAFPVEAPPFRETYVVHLGDDLQEADVDMATRALGRYLLQDVHTELGAALDLHRYDTRPTRRHPQTGVRTFGICCLSFPKERLARLAAPLLCRSLVQGWQKRLGAKQQEELQRACADKWKELGFSDEALTAGFHAVAHSAFGANPQAFFETMMARALPAESVPAEPGTVRQPIVEILRRVDGILDWQRDPGLELGAGGLASAMHQRTATRSATLAQAVIDWLRLLVENPCWRWSGSIFAGQRVLQQLADAAQSVTRELHELRQHCDVQKGRLSVNVCLNSGSAVRKLGSGRLEASAGHTKQKLLDYCWLKLREVALEGTARVLDSVAEQVSAFIRELDSGQVRLRRFAESFIGEAPEAPVVPSPASDAQIVELLPAGSNDLVEAAEKMVRELGPQWIPGLDEAVQAEVLSPRGGLWELLLVENDMEACRQEIEARARKALWLASPKADTAKLFFEVCGGVQEAGEQIVAYLKGCAPRLGDGPEAPLFLALPENAQVQGIQAVVSQAYPEVPITIVSSQQDIVLCRERTCLPIAQTLVDLLENPASYAEIARRVMTRMDVPWCRFEAEVRHAVGIG